MAKLYSAIVRVPAHRLSAHVKFIEESDRGEVYFPFSDKDGHEKSLHGLGYRRMGEIIQDGQIIEWWVTND